MFTYPVLFSGFEPALVRSRVQVIRAVQSISASLDPSRKLLSLLYFAQPLAFTFDFSKRQRNPIPSTEIPPIFETFIHLVPSSQKPEPVPSRSRSASIQSEVTIVGKQLVPFKSFSRLFILQNISNSLRTADVTFSITSADSKFQLFKIRSCSFPTQSYGTPKQQWSWANAKTWLWSDRITRR